MEVYGVEVSKREKRAERERVEGSARGERDQRRRSSQRERER